MCFSKYCIVLNMAIFFILILLNLVVRISICNKQQKHKIFKYNSVERQFDYFHVVLYTFTMLNVDIIIRYMH